MVLDERSSGMGITTSAAERGKNKFDIIYDKEALSHHQPERGYSRGRREGKRVLRHTHHEQCLGLCTHPRSGVALSGYGGPSLPSQLQRKRPLPPHDQQS